MSNKNVDDYLTEGMYGVRRPKEAEREYYLGTLRERIVIALTIGQVMSDKCISQLEETMKNHRNTKLIMNGHVSSKFLKVEKDLANKYNIPYTVITNENNETDIGAVLTYDYAIDKENIFIDEEELKQNTEQEQNESSFFSKIKQWFK